MENSITNLRDIIESLRVGTVLSNNDLMRIFKCANSSGMRRSHKTNTLSIISDHTRAIYEDRWIEDVFHYTGMGLTGDQSLNFAQNKTLNESNSNGIDVHLFEVFRRNEYTYQGRVRLVGSPYSEQQIDSEDNIRTVWVFPLKQIVKENILIPKETLINKEQQRDKMAKKLSDDDLKRKVENIKGKPGTRITTAVAYDRNSDVAEYAKRRANGICQLCEKPAPFNNKKGEPYLESHHLEFLSKGGEDTIYNTVALCPNCHRKMHTLNLVKDVEILKSRIR